jgi:hypothetical protein
MHASAAVHDTPASPLEIAPAGRGTARRCHPVPSRTSAAGISVSTLSTASPTATQAVAVAVGQDTARMPPPPGTVGFAVG